MSVTPEEILTALEAQFANTPTTAATVWLWMVEHLQGQRTNWTTRTVRALEARAVYEMKSGGRSTTAIMATLRLPKRQVQRLYRSELLRRRNSMRQNLAKTG